MHTPKLFAGLGLEFIPLAVLLAPSTCLVLAVTPHCLQHPVETILRLAPIGKFLACQVQNESRQAGVTAQQSR